LARITLAHIVKPAQQISSVRKIFTNLAGKGTSCITGAEGECEQSDVDGGMYEVATITRKVHYSSDEAGKCKKKEKIQLQAAWGELKH
jgi:hypothetical protein